MSERYSRVYVLPHATYTANAPVIISAGALLKDNVSGNIVAQLKFININPKRIKAVQVELECVDAFGVQLGSPISFQYLEQNSGIGEAFGQKVPIPVPDPNTRIFNPRVVGVVFTDDSAVSLAGTTWQALPVQRTLSDALGEDLAEQYKRDVADVAKNEPIAFDGLWICTCGCINQIGEHFCYSCKTEKSKQFLGLDRNTLVVAMKNAILADGKVKMSSNKMSDYQAAIQLFLSIPGWEDADEQVKTCQAQIERIKEDAENARKDSIYSNGWRKMHQSFARIDDLQYAMSEFNKIPGWKDTDAQIVICQQKIDELNAKAEAKRLELERKAELARIEAAKRAKRKKVIAVVSVALVLATIAFFIVLSNVIIPNAKYNDALALVDAGQYQEAIAAFEALDGYKDSAAKIEVCNQLLEKAKLEDKYLQAQTHVQNAQYEDAHRLLQQLRFVDGYTDKVQQLYRQIVDKCRSEGQYDLAVSMYKHINGFSEESEEYKDLVYHSGLAAMERGDYLDAAVAFGKIPGYLDANTQYLEAHYQRGIAYMNSKSYEYAINAFSQAQGHKDSGLQQLEAKYQLVLSLHAYKDAQAFSYLSDLKNAQYKNSADLFNKYYGKPENGDKIVIYAYNSGMALSVKKSGYYNVGVEINDVHAGSFSNDIVLTVIVNNDGTYSFVHESQKLGMEDQYSSVNLGVQYDRWELISLDNGTYLLRNVKRDCFLAFSTQYGDWAAFEASDSDAAKLYQLAFIILDE